MIDHAPLLERAFDLDLREQACVVEDVKGEVPGFVRGTYYLNGPARFVRAGLRYRHWLDGDGMVCSLRFEGGRVRFTSRFVRGAKFVAEEEAGRPLFRTFGTAFESDRMKRGIAIESPVNVSVYRYDDALLAFGEQGLPWALDPGTLETRGEYTFGGRLNAISPFSAHPKFDAGEMFNFGISFSASQPCLNLYRFGAQAAMIYRKRVSLDYPCSTHDFALGPGHAVFYLSPYLLDIGAMMREGRTLMDSLRWEPERGSRLLFVSRETGEQAAAVRIAGRYCLHLINVFEENGRVSVDVLELTEPVYDQYRVVPDLFIGVREARPVRYVVDVARQELVERRELDYGMMSDFPSVDPRLQARSYRDFYLLGISKAREPGRKFFDHLARLGWDGGQDLYHAPPGCYLGGEPVFIPDPASASGGVVICQVFDAARTESAFVLFDASDVARGPVATLRLPSPVRLGFHAAFYPEAL